MLALTVSACAAVGPNFKSPPAPAVTRYTSPDEAALSNADAGPTAPGQTVSLGDKVAVDWWTLFRSEDLDRLVKDAIAGSPTLDSAKARLAAARAEITAASGALYPQIGFSATAERAKESANAFGLSAAQAPLPPNFNFFQLGPTASFTPDLFGGTRRRIEQQAALAEFQRDQLGAAYLTLTGDTVTEAIQLAAVRAQLKVVGDILDIDRQNLDLVRKERQAGSVPDSDVVAAESQLASDETLKPGLDQQLSAAKHAIAILTGRAPGEWSPPDFDLATLTLPGQLPVSLPSDLVRQRPDIQAAEAQLHAASARIGIATAQLYPSITLSAGISASALNEGNLFNPSGLVWSIAAGLTQPIFDGGTRRAERKAALADFKAYAADYKQTVLQSFGQVADILEALKHDAALLAAQQRALDTASESVRLQRINYTEGGAGLINLLDAQRQYQQASLGYARATAQRYQDTIQLSVAMGGGWWGANLTVADNTPARRDRVQ
ncbi:MAG TPA: efflux transporter outer membrane subunit [Caulobacteraceae bacterium]|jgi:NodT family efflux transporter outer membrane factor (OMF) lipoprotein|nr:efflux transporter outer membrane subunit [Caulobacteraceae bacterium]